MNRILSKLGLRPDRDFQRRQAVEDVEAQARMDYLKWVMCTTGLTSPSPRRTTCNGYSCVSLEHLRGAATTSYKSSTSREGRSKWRCPNE